MGKIAVTWTKSTIGYNKRQARVVEALGLRRLNQTVIHDDSPAILGMVQKVRHLLHVEDAAAES